MKAGRGIIVAVAVVLAAALAWAQEPLAVLTEMQLKGGKVEVKTAGDRYGGEF